MPFQGWHPSAEPEGNVSSASGASKEMIACSAAALLCPRMIALV
jgi:hypothetical protein